MKNVAAPLSRDGVARAAAQSTFRDAWPPKGAWDTLRVLPCRIEECRRAAGGPGKDEPANPEFLRDARPPRVAYL